MAKDNKKKATSSKKEKNIKKVQYSLKNGKRKEAHRRNNASNNNSIQTKEGKKNIDHKKIVKKNYARKGSYKKKPSTIKPKELKKQIDFSTQNDNIKNIGDNVVEEKNEIEKEPKEEILPTTSQEKKNKKEKQEAIVIIKSKKKKKIKIKKADKKIKEKKEDIPEPVPLKKKKKIDSRIINKVKEKAHDNLLLGSDKPQKKKRIKKYFSEALFFSIVVTFINLAAMKLLPYANYLKIFDIKWANISLTVILSMVFSYAVSFFIDCFVSELWVKNKNKKQKEGVQNANSGINEGEHQEDIQS